MRAIKFRVFDTNFKKMLLLHEAKFVDGRMIGAKGINWDSKVIVMQWTGLYDKNGKEIYEGDIREGKYYFQTKEERGVEVMEWDNENSCFYWKPICGTIPDFIKIEVIGNIYENPELAGRTE